MYYGQFIISNTNNLNFIEWDCHNLINDLQLKIHPLLEFAKVFDSTKKRKIILLGFIFDPYNPNRNNSEIIKNLLDNSSSTLSLIRLTNKLSGRFIIIYIEKKEMYMFHDAYGLRSIYYTNNKNINQTVYASQPGIISKVLNLKHNESIESEYFNSDYYKNDKEAWIPSGITLYDNVKHLVPNHYLDCQKLEQTRYWPDRKKLKIKPSIVAKECAHILKNTITSAHNRYDLALPITSGYDSRILLAASKDIAHKLYYYTLIYGNLNENSPDITLPNKILKDLGYSHNVFHCNEKMDSTFKDLYMKNVELAYEYYGDIAYGMKKAIPQNKVALKGVSEVARAFFYKIEKNSGRDLAELMEMNSCNFIIDTFQEWIDNSQDVITKNNYKLLDIFYWEHRLGSWRAKSALEENIVHEIIDPFNCRHLIELLLSVDEKYRIGRFKLLRMIIDELWPKLLTYPFDPQTGFKKMKKNLKMMTIRLGIYEKIKKIYRMI